MGGKYRGRRPAGISDRYDDDVLAGHKRGSAGPASVPEIPAGGLVVEDAADILRRRVGLRAGRVVLRTGAARRRDAAGAAGFGSTACWEWVKPTAAPPTKPPAYGVGVEPRSRGSPAGRRCQPDWSRAVHDARSSSGIGARPADRRGRRRAADGIDDLADAVGEFGPGRGGGSACSSTTWSKAPGRADRGDGQLPYVGHGHRTSTSGRRVKPAGWASRAGPRCARPAVKEGVCAASGRLADRHVGHILSGWTATATWRRA